MKNSKTQKSNKAVLTVSIIVALCLCLAAVIGFYNMHSSDNACIVKVNGEAVAKGEFNRYISLNKANVMDYFFKKYGARDSKDFWKSNFNGEVPLDVIKDRALKQCVKTKLQEIQGKKYGIVDDISYEAFIKRFNDENKRRSEALKNNQPVYGPKQYDENGYFSYYFSNMVIKIKEKMSDESKVSDEELKAYYDSIKDEFYKMTDSINAKTVSLSFNADGKADEAKKKEASKAIEEIRDRILKGEDFEKVIKEYTDNGVKGLQYKERVFDNDSARKDSREIPILMGVLENTPVGDVSRVVEENGSFTFVKCISKKNGDYEKYEDCIDSVKLNYIKKEYDSLVERWIEEADIEINQRAFSSVSI